MRPIHLIHCNISKKFTKYDDKTIQLSCKVDRDHAVDPEHDLQTVQFQKIKRPLNVIKHVKLKKEVER